MSEKTDAKKDDDDRNMEMPTGPAPLMTDSSNENVPSAGPNNHSPFRADFDVLDLVMPSRSCERADNDNELFANDLSVESPPPPDATDEDIVSPSVIVGPSTSSSGFLPDILSEERQSTNNVREELTAKMRKLEKLEQTAKELLKKYENIGDLEGQQNVLDMMAKLRSQRETLDNQLMEVNSSRSRNEDMSESKSHLPVTGSRSRSPDQPLNLVRKRPSVDRSTRQEIKLMPLRNSAETNQGTSTISEENVPIDRPTGVLRQNIQDIVIRKAELDKIIRHLRSLTDECRTNSDRTRLSQLIKRHEESIAELNATLGEAQKTLVAMEQLERSQNNPVDRPGMGVQIPQRLQEEDSDDDTAADINHLHELRAKLRNIQQKLSGYADEAERSGAGASASKHHRPSVPVLQPQIVSTNQREVAGQYRSQPPAPQQERGSRLFAGRPGDQVTAESQRTSGKNSISSQERPREEYSRYPGDPHLGINRPQETSWFLPSAFVHNPAEQFAPQLRPQFPTESQVTHRMLNNSPRSKRTTDHRFPPESVGLQNELYGLSSKSGDGYFVIDNIHGRPLERLERLPGRREENSSESDRENAELPDSIYTRNRGESWNKQTNPSFRNDLSVPNKNSNERRNDSSRSRTSNNQEPVDRDYDKNESMRETRSTREMPVPEVVASLQVIMAEQQKILNSCAQFVSKPSVNHDRFSGQEESVRELHSDRSKKSDRMMRDMTATMNNAVRSHGRKGGDVESEVLNNQRRENDNYPYASSPSSLRHESFSHRSEGAPAFEHHDFTSRNRQHSESGKPPGVSQPIGTPDRRNRRSQNRGTEMPEQQSASSEPHGNKGLVHLMNQILKDYRNDLGSLHFMLASIASLRSSGSRATVASQLGLLVTAELDKAKASEKGHRIPSGMYGNLVETLPVHDAARVLLPHTGCRNLYGNSFGQQIPVGEGSFRNSSLDYSREAMARSPFGVPGALDNLSRRSVASPGIPGSLRDSDTSRPFWDAARNDSRLPAMGVWSQRRTDGMSAPQYSAMPGALFGTNIAPGQVHSATEGERLLIEPDGDSFGGPRQNLRHSANVSEQARPNAETPLGLSRSTDRQEHRSGASGSNGDFDIINYYGNSERNGDFDEGLR